MLQYEHSDKIFFDATEALQKMDWEFDIDGTDDARVSAGFKHLVKIRRLLKTINDSNTILSTQLWQQYCPYAQPGISPGFLYSKKI